MQQPDHRLIYCQHLATLLGGSLTGLVVAYFLTLLPIDMSNDLVTAKKLGIVSITVLANYPKGIDLFRYTLLLVVPVLTAAMSWGWWYSVNRRNDLTSILVVPYKSLAQLRIKSWFFLFSLVLLYLSFNINIFYQQITSELSWYFLAEEGSNLAAAQSILSGGVYGKDFQSFYGPLLTYPLALLMGVLEPSVVTERIYTYLLNLCAYVIVIPLLYWTMRSWLLFALSSILVLLFYPPLYFTAPNTTYLRVALGLLPPLLLLLHKESPRWTLPLAGGITLGISLLLSQEVALCSAVTMTVLFAGEMLSERQHRTSFRDMILFLAGCIMAIVPFMIYFEATGALGRVIEDLTSSPRYFALGFGSLPFPTFSEFLRHPSGKNLLQYWPILVYLTSALYLMPLAILRRLDRPAKVMGLLLVFGCLLFRSALGRSDADHAHFAALPALLLTILMIDRTIAGLRQGHNNLQAGVRLLFAGALCGSLILLVTLGPLRTVIHYARTYTFNLFNKWTLTQSGITLPELPRTGGIPFDRASASTLLAIADYLSVHTSADEPVYFFPNEASYYFLFNRHNPVRFPLAYSAATREQRLELIADLESAKPRYVLYNVANMRIDNIPETIQLPEVVAYLNQCYTFVDDLGDVKVLQRLVK